jgi:hypothetical protein
MRATGPSDPVEAVEGFMHALSAGDLEDAETYLAQPIQDGEYAVFLHPGALSDDWRLTEATESGSDTGDLRTVAVTIRDGDDREFPGELQVAGADRIAIVDPYTRIAFQTHYETVVSADGHTAVLPPDAEVLLLPGMYEFAYDAYQLDPAAALGQASLHEPVLLSQALELPDFDAALQEAVHSRLEECQTFLTDQPRGCPFGMPGRLVHADYDEDADIGEGILIDLTAPEWNIVQYPVVEAWENPDLDGTG